MASDEVFDQLGKAAGEDTDVEVLMISLAAGERFNGPTGEPSVEIDGELVSASESAAHEESWATGIAAAPGALTSDTRSSKPPT